MYSNSIFDLLTSGAQKRRARKRQMQYVEDTEYLIRMKQAEVKKYADAAVEAKLRGDDFEADYLMMQARIRVKGIVELELGMR